MDLTFSSSTPAYKLSFLIFLTWFKKNIWLCFVLEVSILISRHVINNLWKSSIFQSDYFHENSLSHLMTSKLASLKLKLNLKLLDSLTLSEPPEQYGTSYSFIFSTVCMIWSPGKSSRCIACLELYISLKSFDFYFQQSQLFNQMKRPTKNVQKCTHMYIFITSVQVNFASLPVIVKAGSLKSVYSHLVTTQLIVR